MSVPPPLPATGKDLRIAAVLNLSIPGAGLYYLGRRKIGAVLATGFMFCFFYAMALFLVGYARYIKLATSDEILEGDRIEQAGQAFPRAQLAGLAVAGAAIYGCSTLLFRSAKRVKG